MTVNEIVEAGVKLIGAYYAIGCCGTLVIVAIYLAFYLWAENRD